jgi:hypothetical protein
MGEDKKPMPVDGSGSERRMADDNGELASRRDGDSAGGLPNVGESGGGAYPNPHSGKEGSSDGPDKFMGHGGQADMGYYGKDQLGEDKPPSGDENNAGSTDE